MRMRPVSGLARFDASPSHELENSQWHQETLNKTRNKGLMQSFLVDTPTLAYRCGGSPGIREPLTYAEIP